MPGLEILTNLFDQLAGALPNVAGAIFILLVGWLITKLISRAVKKLLSSSGIDRLTAKLNDIEIVRKTNLKILASTILSRFLYYVLLLIFAIAATDVLGMETLSNLVMDIINYIPKLITAIILLVIGLLLADSIRDAAQTTCESLGIPSAKMIGGFAFWFIFLTVGVSALGQAGIDTRFIMSNLTVILAGGVAAFALGYGLASKNIVSNFLASFYSKDKVKIGDIVAIDGEKGEVVSIDNTSVTLQSNGKKVLLPLSKLTSEKLEIFEA